MSAALVVVMAGHVAGHVTSKQSRLEFTYDDAYRISANATPLSVSMPLSQPVHRHVRVAPWLDGLLPDDDAVRRRWARRFQVSATSPFALLSTPVGEDCAGAAQFLTDDRLDAVLSEQGDVDWLSETQVAARLRDLREDRTSWLGRDFSGRFSLAGAQAKMALLYDADRDTWGLPTGAAATSHILKPTIAGFDDHELNEYLCLRTAAACGLIVAPARLTFFEDQSAVTSLRYDRFQGAGPWLTRIHQEDLCQALSRSPDNKYENDGGPGIRDICALLRDAVPASLADDAVLRFFDAVTFNWLIGGTDAHAKNYSLLLAGPPVRLAPLYDVASALPYPTDVQRLRLSMKYGGDYSLRSRTPSMWDKVASEFSLPKALVRQHARSLIERIPDALSASIAEPDVAAVGSPLPSLLLDKVIERVTRCSGTLTTQLP